MASRLEHVISSASRALLFQKEPPQGSLNNELENRTEHNFPGTQSANGSRGHCGLENEDR